VSRREQELVELISAYIDGEVTAQERVAAEALLRYDDNARRIHEGLLRARSLLADAQPLPAPPTLRARVMRRISELKSRGPLARLLDALNPANLALPSPALAAGVLLAGAVLVVGTFLIMQPSFLAPATSEQVAGGDLDRSAADSEEEKSGELFAGSEEAQTPPSQAPAEPGAVTGAADELEDRAAPDATAAEEEAQPRARPQYNVLEYEAARQPERRAEAAVAARTGATAEGESGDLVLSVPRPTVFAAIERGPEPAEADRAGAGNEAFYFSTADIYVTERGAPRQIDAAAPPGSDDNPLFDSRLFLPPRFQAFDFIGHGAGLARSEVQVFGHAHVGRDGRILYLRLEGERNAWPLIDAFADRLLATRLLPARLEPSPLTEAHARLSRLYNLPAAGGEQMRVSVFYSFVAVIKAKD